MQVKFLSFITLNLMSMSSIFAQQPLEISTSITINATPEQVWEVFNDFATYESWNPFLTEVSGEVKTGNTIKINAGGMTFKPEVLVCEERQELRWIGKLLVKGLFDGEHHFVFTENADGTTTLQHGEQFTGLLVPLFKNKLQTETKDGFNKMNEALKQRVEDKHSCLSI
ncbi:MAG: SRPBCC family protein [Saprospiraceae bacterium]